MPVITTARELNFCATCYSAGISRLLAGFAIVKDGGRAAVAVPPLPEPLATDVRKAARAVLAARGPGCTARHAEHVSTRTDRIRSIIA